jgi:hypothetical protein
VAASPTIDYSGGTVAAASTCTVSVDVTAASAGTFANTATLNSDAGSSPDATDSLTVTEPIPPPAPGFSKAFTPTDIATNGISTLIFTIDNSAGGIEVGSLLLTDNLPAGVVVAATPNASTTCVGGTLTAVAASPTIDYSGGTVAAASTCTVSVDVTAASAGTFANTATLNSAAGSSSDATDTLTVADPVPTLGPWALLALAVLLVLLGRHFTHRDAQAA